MKRHTICFLLAAMMLPVAADDIVVREIGGVPIVRAKIHRGGKSIEAHILFDMGLDTPMVMHGGAIRGLKPSGGQDGGDKVDIEFSGNVRWEGIPVQVERVKLLEELTAQYAPELKQVPVVAMIGMQAIKSNVVELDLRKGLLRTLGMASDEARAEEMDYEDKPYGIVLKGTGPTQAPVRALVTMRSEDSTLDLSLLRAARKAGKKPNVLEISGIKFSDHTAIRFGSLDETAPEHIDAVIGIGALRDFTVTAWPKRRKIAFLPHTSPSFPPIEQDYYFALADKKPDGVADFIRSGPRRRLMDEACLALWEMRFKDPLSKTPDLQQALKTLGAHFDPKRRSATLSKMADRLEGGTRPDKEELVELALNLAMKQSMKALDQTATHAVHLRLGKRAFATGDFKQARRHLLSAAFGMPKNGECNFWLGEAYRKMDKPRRAWSRYFQAILDSQVDDTVRKDSLARLDELNRDPVFRETFNMVIGEQYMAGRLDNAEFHAPSRYALVKDRFPGHVKLVECFTNATVRETGGMQLAFQALDEDFAGAIALIAYHLDDPMHSEVAARRLDYYKVARPPLAVFDGETAKIQDRTKNGELQGMAAAIYPAFREACLREETAGDPAWTLDAKMVQDGTKVSGSLTVTGGGETDKLRLHAILCERSVMAPEDNGVFFHHFVARRALTPPDGLALEAALEKAVEFSVDAEKMGEALTRMLDGDKRPGGWSKPTHVDPNKLMVVAFVQHHDGHHVLAAKSFNLPQEDDVL